jgi:predicted ATPase
MVLVFEDWHWVDEASDSALKHIIGEQKIGPVPTSIIGRPV